MRCRRLEHYDKGRFVEVFWEADRAEITSGSLGSKGRTREETFSHAAECDELVAELVAKRLREGYVEVVPEVLRAQQVQHVAPDAEWIARIAEAYDDDAPRLVYADHLESLGDPLGELIAVQCELARIEPWEPRAAVLREREDTLMLTYRPRWLPKIEPEIKCTFHRGFVERVAPEPSVREPDFERLQRHAPLIRTFERNMSLEHWGDRAPWAIAPRALLEQLTGMAIDTWSQSAPGLAELVTAPELARVDRLALTNTPLAKIQVRTLATRAWRELVFRRCLVREDSIGTFLETAAPRLEALIFDSTVAYDDGVRAIAKAPLPRLRRLTLHRAHATRATFRELGRSPSLTALAALDVSENPDVVGLFGEPQLPALTELVLRQTELDDDGLAALLASPLAAQLRVLDLSGNKLGDPRPFLEATLPALRMLDVSKNPLAKHVRELRAALPHVRVTARAAHG